MLVTRLFPKQKSLLTARNSVLVCLLAVFLLTGLFLPAMAEAQGTDRFGLQAASGMGLGTTDLIVVISNIVRIILGMLGILAVLLIMYAGFVWMTASGDADKVTKAKKILVSAIIGLVIIMSAFTIASFIINALTGNFYGTTPGGERGPGSLGDLGRWGIGRGPIESVYPEPNATDIPINTRVIVTFKEQIKSGTICEDDNNNGCDNETMKNVEICEMDEKGDCVADGEPFGKDAFAGSKVKETTDKRTFVFTPVKYLGALNEQTKFKVTLREGIRTVANPDNSVFSMLSGNQYAWAFTTNGKLDLDPPEIKDLTGVYPYPDFSGDDYEAGAPTPTVFAVFAESEPEAQADSLVGNFAAGNENTNPDNISSSGTYTGVDSGTLGIAISSADGKITAKWPGDAQPRDSGFFEEEAKSFSANGLTIIISAEAARGNAWTANLQAAYSGDRLQIKKSGTAIKTLVYGQDIEASENLNQIRENIAAAVVSGLSSDFVAIDDPYSFKTKLIGAISKAYTFVWLAGGETSEDVYVSLSSAGSDGDIAQTVSGRQDPFRNTVFQINFNEAIDPTEIDGLIVKRGENLLAAENDYKVEVGNQYRTLELRGNVECGMNSCGDKIYCWPVDGSAEPTPYNIEIKAARLVGASDPRCAPWGGSAGSNSRCQKEIGGQAVFYPVAVGEAGGIIDLGGNSFNGSFDYYEENGERVGAAQGQSGSGDGASGHDPYYLNQGMQCVNNAGNVSCSDNSARIVSYGSSSDFGDNFKWSFFLSPRVDTQAPLANTISPTGGQEILDSYQPIEVVFDRLMRGATLRPGYNYGSNAKSKSLRYLVLDVITNRINPAGYWVSREEADANGDGWAEKSVARVSHNVFGVNADYSFLAGSGVQSITQNCFLPSGGPKEAGADPCAYNGEDTAGCVRDSNLGNKQVKLPNPASYGKLDCKQIAGTDECEAEEVCQVLYFDKNKAESYLSGSWVITNDFSLASAEGRTGCCFGKCVSDSGMKECRDLEGAEVCEANEICQADNNQGGYWIRTKGLNFDESGRTGCCFGKCVAE